MYMSNGEQASSLAAVAFRPAAGHRNITAAKVATMTWNSLDQSAAGLQCDHAGENAYASRSETGDEPTSHEPCTGASAAYAQG